MVRVFLMRQHRYLVSPKVLMVIFCITQFAWIGHDNSAWVLHFPVLGTLVSEQYEIRDQSARHGQGRWYQSSHRGRDNSLGSGVDQFLRKSVGGEIPRRK